MDSSLPKSLGNASGLCRRFCFLLFFFFTYEVKIRSFDSFNFPRWVSDRFAIFPRMGGGRGGFNTDAQIKTSRICIHKYVWSLFDLVEVLPIPFSGEKKGSPFLRAAPRWVGSGVQSFARNLEILVPLWKSYGSHCLLLGSSPGYGTFLKVSSSEFVRLTGLCWNVRNGVYCFTFLNK